MSRSSSCRRTGPVAVLVSILGGCSGGGSLEQPAYAVLEQDGELELRAYESFLMAETHVSGDLDAASNEAFRRLAGYIFGANSSSPASAADSPEASVEIAMTSPVSMVADQAGWTMSFMMPASFTLDTLPVPQDSRVVLRGHPAKTLAAIRYSGRWSSERRAAKENELIGWLAQRGLRPAGSFIFARYDPPWIPFFLRRNEVLVEVQGGRSPLRERS